MKRIFASESMKNARMIKASHEKTHPGAKCVIKKEKAPAYWVTRGFKYAYVTYEK